MKSEEKFKSDFKKELRTIFPECEYALGSSTGKQGFPDLIILYRDKHVYLEFKKFKGAPERPNQKYYVDKYGKHCYTNFIYPENKEEVLNDIKKYFK